MSGGMCPLCRVRPTASFSTGWCRQCSDAWQRHLNTADWTQADAMDWAAARAWRFARKQLRAQLQKQRERHARGR